MYLHPLKIGNLNLKTNILIAPISGYTNLPSRLVYREQNNCLFFTEMVSALGLLNNFNKSVNIIKSEINDTPLGIQIFGPDSEKILRAFLKIKNLHFDLIDINCGCSIKKVVNSYSGAYLLQKPAEIYNIIKLLKENTDKPVSIKIRSGWDNSSINFFEILDSAQSAAADMITFHPRTKSMLFKGKADWQLIKLLKEKSKIPVIANGDIFTGNDALNIFDATKCDGIMIARGLIENPFLIEEITYSLSSETYSPPLFEKRKTTLLRHCELMIKYFGEKRGICSFRKYLRGYLKGMPESSRLKQKLQDIDNLKNFVKIINDYFHSLEFNLLNL